jgi:hypothetical protein
MYVQAMHDDQRPSPASITRHIVRTYPETDVVTIPGATFFSLDPERHFPNFATIVENDDHDQASDLSRPGVFRLNLGVDRVTFERIDREAGPEPDHTVFDVLLPHPVYARQRWISILDPSAATFHSVVIPLIALAHDRLAAQRARHASPSR